jgi:hypothetical protein
VAIREALPARKAARLDVVVAGGGRVHTAPGLDDDLVDQRSLAVREEAMLAHELEGRLVGGHPGHRGHRLVGPDQQIHLLLEADLEGITLHGGHVLAGDDRRRRETHRLAAEPRRGARDPAGEAGRLAETVGVQAVDTGEAPCPVDDRPDAHPLVLQRGDLREPPALDRHRLDAALDDAAIRVGRAAGHGDVDGQVGDLSHRRFIADGARLRPGNLLTHR